MNQSDKDLLGLSATGNDAASEDPLSGGGQAQQALKYYLSLQMAKVPGFTPPGVSQENLCPLPNASEEEVNEFRSAGVLLKALAAEAKAWSAQLPPDYYPAIIAILHGGLQVQVRTLAQVSFDGIRIEGLLGESPCSVLAHQNTVQLVCHATRIDEEAEEEPHPIGFIWPDHNEKIPRSPVHSVPTPEQPIPEPPAPEPALEPMVPEPAEESPKQVPPVPVERKI